MFKVNSACQRQDTLMDRSQAQTQHGCHGSQRQGTPWVLSRRNMTQRPGLDTSKMAVPYRKE